MLWPGIGLTGWPACVGISNAAAFKTPLRAAASIAAHRPPSIKSLLRVVFKNNRRFLVC
jgi:hypothetical protein